jgi:hypothetical protein
MGNDYVVDLVRRERNGEDVTERIEKYNTTYLRLYDAFLRLYEGQYPIMGNAQVMTAKVAWDNACYWAITALLYFQRRYRDPGFIDSIDNLMRRFFVLHARMQQFLKTWSEIDSARYGAGATSVVAPDWLRRLQADLGGPMLDDAALRERLETNFAALERFASTLQALASSTHGDRPEFARLRVHAAAGPAAEIDALRVRPVNRESLISNL